MASKINSLLKMSFAPLISLLFEQTQRLVTLLSKLFVTNASLTAIHTHFMRCPTPLILHQFLFKILSMTLMPPIYQSHDLLRHLCNVLRLLHHGLRCLNNFLYRANKLRLKPHFCLNISYYYSIRMSCFSYMMSCVMCSSLLDIYFIEQFIL